MRNFLIMLICIGVFWQIFLTPPQIKSDVPYKLKYKQEVFGSTSTKKLPMIILLHGSGANEKDIIKGLSENRFDIPIRGISLRGPLNSGLGFRWAYGTGKTYAEASLAHDKVLRDVGFSIAQSTDELLKKFPTVGKPFVFGFSEGASIAYYLAVNYQDKFSAVFVCSGELTHQFFPESIDTDLPPIHVYHGKNDSVISISSAKRTISDIGRFSDEIYLLEYDTGHSMTRSAVDDMENNILEYVRSIN
ncbi:MAG: hypothetical protein KJ915_01940 [Candidatus Omnitrophica bacterium]|nr:hypothetical protein [Candidatus Omnitrophota bacterium]